MINDREQQIFEAFAKLALRKHENKELPQITIAEIAKEAGISKQAMTKYHFKTLEELVDTMHRRMSLDIHSTFANFSPEQKICPITVMAEYVLPALYPWMNLIKAAYVAYADASWMEYVEKQNREWILPYVSEISKTLDVAPELIANLVTDNAVNIIKLWITPKYPKGPDEFSVIFTALARKTINPLLNREYRLPENLMKANEREREFCGQNKFEKLSSNQVSC